MEGVGLDFSIFGAELRFSAGLLGHAAH